MFAGMLDQPPGHIGDSRFPIGEGIDYQVVQSLVAFLLDRGGAVRRKPFLRTQRFVLSI